MEYLPYNTIELGGEQFFKRTVIYQGELIDVVFIINANGKVLDGDNDRIALPCPRFCDDNQGGLVEPVGEIEKIGLFGVELDTLPDAIPTGYDVDLAKNLKNSEDGYNKFLELEIIDVLGATKIALVGIDSNGRIMDDDSYELIIK